MRYENQFTEKDWKLFRKKLPKWQENYMGKLIKEYTELLTNDDKAASERFWELDKRIKKDKKKTGVIAYNLSRSNMIMHIINLLDEEAITMTDLDDFSDLFKDTISTIVRINEQL